MNQLKCATMNCQHNLKDHCGCNLISFSDKAVCDSKIKRVGGALEQTFAELEVADDMLPDAPQIVKCDAKCVYNEDGNCTSTSLYIADFMLKTRCKTRIKE